MRTQTDGHLASMFNKRTLTSASIEARKSTNTVLWCVPHSETYVIFTITQAVSEISIERALDTAAGYVAQYVNQIGDTVINKGSVEFYGGDGVFFKSWNVNNHQQTWGVLAAAIAALKDYMSQNYFGRASFNIFDGRNEVGEGTVGL